MHFRRHGNAVWLAIMVAAIVMALCPLTFVGFLRGLAVLASNLAPASGASPVVEYVGAGSLYLKPVSRVTVNLGYAITSSTGSALILNQNSPTGPLNFNYHLPTASFARPEQQADVQGRMELLRIQREV